ncbi:exodeoxyribonuclease V subunit gamma [Thiomonas sp.]|uniref:exodeoxyribonuclease V subunit gamma n=1 Tax=Thiomonas sp. TaxID=2047785 RepID=UPI002612EB3E|nr:exodeoxyribonuclease V subunit gamma [Thiomonas sp.]
MTSSFPPGLLILHGNRLDMLRDVLLHWLAQHPLAPLEEEIILVPSNGTAEWFKMSLAAQAGVCAATRVELPGRFVWRLYRQVLGAAQVPSQSALDKDVLTWRLMRLLPGVLPQPGYEPLAGYLRGQDSRRTLQLACKLADLYDQYQIYRDDWLDAWAEGRDVLIDARGASTPLPADQRWQAQLWRAILDALDPAERAGTRPQVRRRVLRALEQAPAGAFDLPRRVVLFGASHLPRDVLDTLAALARHAQILLALANPCRYHWADIIDGRELLRAAPPRQPARRGSDLATVSLEAMHAHAHPLLAAWGRQGRDLMRQLDALDARAAQRHDTEFPREGLFDDAPGDTLLQQVQAAIRDLLPLAEHPPRTIPAADRSLVFHIAHSAQREVEVLHDQLLDLLAPRPGVAPLQPRDIVVMVPDIEPFAPAIRAVFGQYPPDDARYIPYDIADLPARAVDPLLAALDGLLRLPEQRLTASDLVDWLDVPAIARRFGLQPQDLPRLTQWIDAAGVRWGLDAAHRAQLGLAACGEQNSWRFGLRRMLLGYTGAGDDGFAGIVPYDDIGGLDAALLGPLADLVDVLQAWRQRASEPATPQQWAQSARDLLDAISLPQDSDERLTRTRLDDALTAWVDDCAAAGFDAAVPLDVFREGWLGALDAVAGGGRFLAGGVTFCTLMPLRSIPFDVVCLLGMNEGDYPRQAAHSDFDLLRTPGQYRPGDRARRDDDRYLMLEALLSARRMLYVSWAGRNPRDNTEQPPSVLVAQLRDYLDAGWRGDGGEGSVLTLRTTVHPLQPFSRRYFEGDPALFTFAREWRAVHAGATPLPPAMPPAAPPATPLTVQQLARFLKNPVQTFFRIRLDVVFDALHVLDDDEVFGLDGLSRHALLQTLIDQTRMLPGGDVHALVAQQLRRLQHSGVLPLRALGERAMQELQQDAVPVLLCWQDLQRRYPQAVDNVAVTLTHQDVQFDDWLGGLRSDGRQTVWVQVTASRLLESKGKLRADKLVDAWLRQLAVGAAGLQGQGLLLGTDALLRLPPLAQAQAREHLGSVLAAWRDGLQQPLPFTARTALADVSGGRPADVYHGGYRHGRMASRAEIDEPCLARVFPDFDALCADGRYADYRDRLFQPLWDWAQQAEVTPHGVEATS